MIGEDASQNDLKGMIASRGFLFVILWAAGILLLYAVGGYLGVRKWGEPNKSSRCIKPPRRFWRYVLEKLNIL
jgi:hypothetical protein